MAYTNVPAFVQIRNKFSPVHICTDLCKYGDTLISDRQEYKCIDGFTPETLNWKALMACLDWSK